MKSFTKLTDGYSRVHNYLRISLTEKCNLRCTYCMPNEQTDRCNQSEFLKIDEIGFLSTYFCLRGIRKIRLTGGEPTIRKDLVKIIESLNTLKVDKNILDHLCMTTNGITMKHQAFIYKSAGLDSVNISLDSLIPDRVHRLTGLPIFKTTMAGILTAIEAGFENVKINCVVMKNFNDDELCNFVELTRNLPIEVRFIEYMPFGGNRWDWKKLVTFKDMHRIIKENYPCLTKIENKASDTAKLYHVPGWFGKIGFISSMTSNFCSHCTRLRLTADGNLKTCLHGQDETNLIKIIRHSKIDLFELTEKILNFEFHSNEMDLESKNVLNEITHMVDQSLMKKAAAHADANKLVMNYTRPMVRIGG